MLRTIGACLAFTLVLAGLGTTLDGERGLLLGALAGLVASLTAAWIKTLPTKVLLGGVVGLFLGILSAYLLLAALGGMHLGEGLDLPGIRDTDLLAVKVLVVGAMAYVGVIVGMRRGAALSFEGLPFLSAKGETRRQHKILDTSVVIDGRVAEVVTTGFLEGTLVLPQFVLRELQQVADSADPLKRNRGRRGLDILKELKQSPGVHVVISEVDYPELKEVDQKLIELAKQLDGRIVTNDFNLNKVAELRGVKVLNINELANSLKPAVLVGEVMRVFILKEGKEISQGIAYLDDGTMVVVDSARRAIGKTVDITVTSIHQTTAGKMIFGRYDAAVQPEGGAGAVTAAGDRREPRRRVERLGSAAPGGEDH
jgi:uncharacterized protein YacL